MNISEALSELKNTKTRIARLLAMREVTLKYNKETSKPEKSFDQLTHEIIQLAHQATAIKIRIAYTNVTTPVAAKNGVSLNELILIQGEMRSEIAALKKILGVNKQRRGYESNVFDSGYSDKEVMFQKNRFEIERLIQELEKEKRSFDAIIQQVNWSTNIK